MRWLPKPSFKSGTPRIMPHVFGIFLHCDMKIFFFTFSIFSLLRQGLVTYCQRKNNCVSPMLCPNWTMLVFLLCNKSTMNISKLKCENKYTLCRVPYVCRAIFNSHHQTSLFCLFQCGNKETFNTAFYAVTSDSIRNSLTTTYREKSLLLIKTSADSSTYRSWWRKIIHFSLAQCNLGQWENSNEEKDLKVFFSLLIIVLWLQDILINKEQEIILFQAQNVFATAHRFSYKGKYIFSFGRHILVWHIRTAVFLCQI